MLQIPIFHGRISADGKFELAERERILRQQYFKSLAGRNVEIVVRKERVQRSLDQNKYWHAVPFPILADCWGEDIETTKLLVLGECFGWRESLGGQRVPMKPSTSNLTVEEGTYLTDWMPPWAMKEFRLVIPYPNEAEGA